MGTEASCQDNCLSCTDTDKNNNTVTVDLSPKPKSSLKKHYEQPPQKQQVQVPDSNLQLPSRLNLQSKMTVEKELFLQIDENWLKHLMEIQKNPIDILSVYKQRAKQEVKSLQYQQIICKRVALNNRKLQILFNQNIPMIGHYYFQVELISYLPKEKCEFTVGIVDYFQAFQYSHCRDRCAEQSYTYKQRSLDITEELGNVPIILNKKFKVEIKRESSKPSVIFSVDGDIVSQQKLKKEFEEKTLSMVPFLQTQYQGIEFSWKSPKKNSTINYQMTVITEENSSVNT